jgi:N,N'-diacetyllegionaminate synthase
MNIYERLTDSNKPFIVAEIGSNHNGEIEKAKKLIDTAVEAGCDAVKFQSWDYNSLFAQSILDDHKDLVAKDVDAKGLEDVQKKLALTKEAHIELKKYADKKNIIFFSYPLSNKHVDWLVEIGAPILKVGSLDIVNLPLLRYMAKQNKPIILSVGMSNLGEIEQALETIYSEGNKQVVLMHCNASYPPKYEDIHLRNISMLKTAFNVPVGFSDHSTSIAIPCAAVALGATVIEKHIKLDNLHCRDEAVSLAPQELKQLVESIRNTHLALGSTTKIISEDEKKRRVSVFGRRSILTKDALKSGTLLTEENLTFKRPGIGISPNKLELVLGKKLKVDKEKEEVIAWNELE